MTSIDQFAAAIRQMESGGNYQAVGADTNYGRATGAYQFIDSTWGGYGGYKRAADAPPAVQDARAKQLMQNYYDYLTKKGATGDQVWRLMAIAWAGGMGAAERALRTGSSGAYDPYAHIGSDDYGNRIMGLLKSGVSTTGSSGSSGPTGTGTPAAPVEPFDQKLADQLSNLVGMLNAPPTEVTPSGV